MRPTYYHAMLGRTFEIKNVVTTKRHVRFEIVNPPEGVQAKRSMTLKHAREQGIIR